MDLTRTRGELAAIGIGTFVVRYEKRPSKVVNGVEYVWNDKTKEYGRWARNKYGGTFFTSLDKATKKGAKEPEPSDPPREIAAQGVGDDAEKSSEPLYKNDPRRKFYATYLANLLDAELTGGDFRDPDLDQTLFYRDLGASGPSNLNDASFGRKLDRLSVSDSPLVNFVRSKYPLESLNSDRKQEIHNDNKSAGDNPPTYPDGIEDVIAQAEKLATVGTGKDFDQIAPFEELEKHLQGAIGSIDPKRSRKVTDPSGSVARETLGATILRNSKKMSRPFLEWAWRFNSLRNRYVHTGRITPEEREFLASAPKRLVGFLDEIDWDEIKRKVEEHYKSQLADCSERERRETLKWYRELFGLPPRAKLDAIVEAAFNVVKANVETAKSYYEKLYAEQGLTL